MGCSSKDLELKKEMVVKDIPKKEKKAIEIYDLINIPQDVSYFTKKIKSNTKYYDVQQDYEKEYFSMWNIKKPIVSLSTVKWPFDSFKAGNSYGENLQLLKQDFFNEMLENSNFDVYLTLNKKAITLRSLNIRAFPTDRPLLRDPALAGEGFPFDYLQNTTIHANKPILISHYSKDREWVYIFSSFASGWVKSNEVVTLEKKHTDMWQKAQQIFIVRDSTPIYSIDGGFLFQSKVGMMFALIDEDSNSYTVLAVKSYKDSKPLFVKSKISKSISHKNILNLNADNLTYIVNEVSKTNYGWGGMYGQRDCSSMLRDMFAPFGVWLPRNSYQQSKYGKVISLENLSDDEKIATIKAEGIPFQTLLYKQGHIVLYVGTYENDVIVFHNTWGIKTKKDDVEGRIIIGKAIFSTLRLGKNQKNYDEEAEILRNLKSMNILTQ